MTNIKSGPTAIVPKDPQPSVDRIDDLARRILTGDTYFLNFNVILFGKNIKFLNSLTLYIKTILLVASYCGKVDLS